MLKLRPYREADAETIVRWIEDETTMRKLAANLYDSFPLSPETMIRQYRIYKTTHSMIACVVEDEAGSLCGHFVYLFRPEDPDTARLCFVITDSSRRGQGIGTEMVRLAVQNAFDQLNVKRVTLCVFANNPYAHQCYCTAGFRDLEPVRQVSIMGESRECIDMELEAAWN